MQQRVRSLQALRGIACLLVVAFHVAHVEAGLGNGVTPFAPALQFGYAGVDLFFVLSGFIIASTARGGLGVPARLPSFLVRRAWRIYPPYWAAFALFATVGAATGVSYIVAPPNPADWGRAVLLLPLPGGWQPYSVAWTLCYELMFYLGFGLLFLLPRRAAPHALAAWAALVVGAAIVGFTPANPVAGLALSPYVLEFLGGTLVATATARLRGRWAMTIGVAAVAWAAVGVAASDPTWLVLSHIGRAVIFGLPATLIVFAASAWERAGGWPGWRFMERLGDASYSVYLIHEPALLYAECVTAWLGWGHGPAGHAAWLAVLFMAATGGGVAFHWYLERPLLNLAKRKMPQREPHSLPAAALA